MFTISSGLYREVKLVRGDRLTVLQQFEADHKAELPDFSVKGDPAILSFIEGRSTHVVWGGFRIQEVK